MTETPARISASQVRLILERAAEIDARGDSLTVEELRRIAAEAEIDPAATETAIQEITASIEATFIGGLIVRFGPREEEPEDDVQRIGPGEQ